MTLMARLAPEVRPAEPTSTLRFIAGEHADRVAALWAPPHGAYLEMPAQRRHLVHFVLAFASVSDAEDLRAALEGARADDVARRFVGSPPPGFVRSLARIGEAAWSGEDYLRLFGLFADAGGAAVLMQTPEITAALVRAIEGLPSALRTHAIARHLGGTGAAEAVGAAWRAIRQVRGDIAAVAAIARWSRAGDAKRLFAMASQDLAPQRFDPAPYPVHPDMRRLGGTTAVEDAGRRFRNCLATYADRAALGMIALYEWAGPPPAALALVRDGFFGWRLEEARGIGNLVLDAEDRVRIIAALEAAGVRVGRSGADLRAALRKRADLDHDWINPGDPVLNAFGIYEEV